MTYQVTLQPSGHQFTVNNEETILEAALREGFSLPYGCRNGACGSCKGKVLSGQLDYGKHSPTALKDEESAVVKAFELGADDFVGKPFNPQELVLRIRRYAYTVS